VLLLIALAAAALAPQAAPVFEAGVDVVAIDANVVDARGVPARGLLPDDFIVTVDGKPRRVVATEFVDFTAAPPEAPPAAPPEARHFSTNEGVRPGRLVLLAIDQGNISAGRGRAAIRAADRLLDQLTPSDRIGLVAFPPPGPGVDPTADHKAVRDALAKVVGRGQRQGTAHLGPSDALAFEQGDSLRWDAVESRECPEPSGAEGRQAAGSGRDREACIEELQGEAMLLASQLQQQSRASLRSLEALFDALAAIDGPKTVLLLTEGLRAEDAAQVRGLADRAAAAHVALYVLQIETPWMPDASIQSSSTTALEDRELRDNALSALAALSRGTVFRLGGSGEGVYDQISRELSGNYLLRLEPEATDRDGRDHEIRVTTTRKGLQVRARGRLRIPPPGKAPKDEERLAAALAAPFLVTQLPIRVTSYTLRDRAPGKLKLLLAAEIAGVEGDALSYAFRVLDEKGQLVASGGQRLRELGGDRTVALTTSASVAPGSYTLRLAALDAAGRRGSVEHRLTAALHSAGGLELGDLLLGPEPSAGHGFRPGVDVRAAGAVVALVEVYPREAAQLDTVSVAFEVAESEAGPTLLSLPARLARPSEGAFVAGQARIPTNVLPPGDYVARAIVSLAGRPAGQLSQPFHALPAAAAATTGEAAVPRELLLPALSRFDRGALLRPEVVGHFLDRVNELVPGPRSPSLEEAMARARHGEVEGVLAALGSADDSDPRVAFLRGLGHLARGALPQATAAFHTAVARASNLLPAMVYLGACDAASGRDREAIGAWQTALISESASPAVYAALADALLRLDEAGRAVEIAKEALASSPDDEAMKRRLGLGLARAGRQQEALALLTEHVEKHPDDAGALLVTLRLLFQALTSAGAAGVTPQQKERASNYARAYLAAAPADQQGRAMVAHWLRYLEKTRQ
jgi:VWFA-related protein